MGLSPVRTGALLECSPARFRLNSFDRLQSVFVVGMQGQYRAVGLDRLVKPADLLEDHAETAQGDEVPRIKSEHPAQIIDSGADIAQPVIGARPAIIGRGIVGIMIDGGCEMLDRDIEDPLVHRVLPAAEQKIDRGGPALGPFGADRVLDTGTLPRLRLAKLAHQVIDEGLLRQTGSGKPDSREKCRDDTFVEVPKPAHNPECSVTIRSDHSCGFTFRKGQRMSDVVAEAVAALTAKMGGQGFDGSAKFVISGEGALIVDASGCRASDDPADVTLTADADTFKSILDGDLNPTAAFMTGRLSVDGDMGQAMKLAGVLS